MEKEARYWRFDVPTHVAPMARMTTMTAANAPDQDGDDQNELGRNGACDDRFKNYIARHGKGVVEDTTDWI